VYYNSDPLLKRTLVAAGVLVAVLLLSVLLFVFRPHRTVQRILFFPDATTGVWRGELRELPVQPDRESEMEYVLKEMILGPTVLQHARALPRETQIHSVIYRDRVLYIDFSAHLIFDNDGTLPDFQDMLKGVRSTIEYNYPRVEQVQIFIDGSAPKALS